MAVKDIYIFFLLSILDGRGALPAVVRTIDGPLSPGGQGIALRNDVSTLAPLASPFLICPEDVAFPHGESPTAERFEEPIRQLSFVLLSHRNE
ncbi:hypothetical protein MTO96_040500 [Rhipicephalus appendiculatus]